MTGAKLTLALLLPSAFVLPACGDDPVPTAFVEKEVTRQAQVRAERADPAGRRLRIVAKCARRESNERTFACLVRTTVDAPSPLAVDKDLRPVTVAATVSEDRQTVVVEGLEDLEALVEKPGFY